MRPEANSPEIKALVARLVAGCKLTPAIAEVALGLWYGLTEKEVARWLGKSRDTVHEHVLRLYRDQRWPAMKCRVTVALAVERELSGPRK